MIKKMINAVRPERRAQPVVEGSERVPFVWFDFVTLRSPRTAFSLLIFSMLFLSSCDFGGGAKKAKLVVVNVLDKSLHDDCHIKGSVNVPFEQVQEYAAAHWPKDTELVFYCTNYKCSASGEAARQLKALGYEKVYAYEAGIAEWHKLGFAVVGTCSSPVLKDYERPEGLEEPTDVTVLSSQELKKKIDELL